MQLITKQPSLILKYFNKSRMFLGYTKTSVVIVLFISKGILFQNINKLKSLRAYSYENYKENSIAPMHTGYSWLIVQWKLFFLVFEILTNHVRSFIMQTDFLEFYERIWLNYHKNQQRYLSGADIVSFFKKLLKFVFLQSVTNKQREIAPF